jgi:hypothetical protein
MSAGDEPVEPPEPLRPLMERLRGIAAAADPPPALATELARAAFGTRGLDHELAELVADSHEVAAAGVRGDGDVRLLSFAAPALSIEMQVSATGAARTVLGQVVGATATAVSVQGAHGRTPVPVDEFGRFRAERLTAGPARVQVTLSDGTTVTTSWTTL